MGLNIKLCALSSASAFLFLFFLKNLKRRFKLMDKLTQIKSNKCHSPSEILEAIEKGDKKICFETINANEKLLRNALVIGKSLKFDDKTTSEYIYHMKKTTHNFSNNYSKVKELLISSSPFKLIDLNASEKSRTYVSIHQNDKVECLIDPETIKNTYTPIKLSLFEKLGLLCSTSIYLLLNSFKLPTPLKNFFVGINDSEFVIKYGGQIMVLGDLTYNFTDKTMKIEHPLKFLSNSIEILLKRVKAKIWKNDLEMIFYLSCSLGFFYFARESYKGAQSNKIQEKFRMMDKDKFITTQGKDFKCMVCRNKQKNVILQPCSHLVMCKACVERSKEKEQNCPLCKQKYTETIEILIP